MTTCSIPQSVFFPSHCLMKLLYSQFPFDPSIVQSNRMKVEIYLLAGISAPGDDGNTANLENLIDRVSIFELSRFL